MNVYRQDNPYHTVKLYALIDDQSNRSLAKSELFDLLNINSEPKDFQLQTCSGVNSMTSRIGRNLMVSSLDGNTIHRLPPTVECETIPDNRKEISTPDVGNQFPHLAEIANYITELDPQADILLLIDRNLIEAHHVLDQNFSMALLMLNA